MTVKIRSYNVVKSLVGGSDSGEGEVDGRVVSAHNPDKVDRFTWRDIYFTQNSDLYISAFQFFHCFYTQRITNPLF